MQAIHHAAVGGHVELVVLLIEQFGVSPQEKADVCSQPFPCVATFPLHIFKLACSRVSLPTISSTAKQKDGEEAIYSCYLLSMTMYNLLCRNLHPQEDLQPLHYAAIASQVEMIQLLVDVYGVSPNATASVCAKLIPPLVPHLFFCRRVKSRT